jgi:hypothetical protein
MKHPITIVLTGVVLAALAPTAARADQLDKKLNDEMPGVMKYLREQRYKNVGVLRFRVQKGKRPARFDNAPLNGNMATRLENLLVIHGGPDDSKAIGVIHNAGQAAARQKVGSWFTNRDQRHKLFDASYPLAWGNRNVKASAILTGKVVTSEDLKQTTVQIVCFDRNNVALKEVIRFTLPTDRSLITDLGYSYVLSRGKRDALVARRDDDKVDQGVVEEVKEEEEKKGDKVSGEDKKQDEKGGVVDEKKDDKKDEKKDDKKYEEKKDQKDDKKYDDKKPGSKSKYTDLSPTNIAGIEFKMLVDGKDQDIRESGTQGDTAPFQVECPPPGKPIYFTLRNTTEKKLGVVLKLNGVSTFNQQQQSPESCQKWVIGPGKTYTIKGFYMQDNGGDDYSTKRSPRKSAARRDEDKGPVNDEEKPGKKDGGKPGPKTTVLPFKVLIGEDAKVMKADLGDKAGLIEIDVFSEGEVKGGDPDMEVTTKGLPPSKDKAVRRTRGALRSALLKNGKLKTEMVSKREVIVPDKEAIAPGGLIKLVDWPSYPVARLVIKLLPNEGKY